MADDAGAPRAVEDLCSSPWLIVYGQGPVSERIARTLAEQCRPAHIRTRVRAIDNYRDADLAGYRSLVAVLPTYTSELKIRVSLEPFAQLAADYRLRWQHGLTDIVAGVIDPLDAGVLGLIGERVLLHNPAMRSALRRACYVHDLDEDGPADAFRPLRHTAGSPSPVRMPWDDTDDVAADVLRDTWACLNRWGVTDPAQVTKLVTCIQLCCAYYENPIKPLLYRPHPDFDRNRLDLILHGPDVRCGDLKTWNENGARVWRYVLGQIQLVAPRINRPGNPNARGAQKDLQRFYNCLRIIDQWLNASGNDSSTLTA